MENDKKVVNTPKSRKTQAWWDEHGNRECDIIRLEGVDRLVTRNLLRNTEFAVKNDDFIPGTLVWGYCRGWWPALIIAADDVKIPGNSRKVWVFWLTDAKVSQLKKKSQVILFCDGLKDRLISVLSKMRNFDNFFIEIMELLGQRINQPFITPYTAWTENHFSSLKTHKNHLAFHPYPPKIQQHLANLKTAYSQPIKPNPPAKRKGSEKKCEGKFVARKNSSNLHVKHWNAGSIVWAKIAGQIWWPAMIIDHQDCAMSEPKLQHDWVMWYGDYTLSLVIHKNFLDFSEGIKKFEDHIKQSKRELYRRGILEASKDYCALYCKTNDWDLSDVFDWFKSSGDNGRLLRDKNSPGAGGRVEDQRYSRKIREELARHVGRSGEAAVREHKLQDKDLLSAITKNSKKSICLMCFDVENKNPKDHPFFEGFLCGKCSMYHKSTIFAYDDDGKSFYCTLCASRDTVVICDNPDCPRVYCVVCLQYLISPDSYQKILRKESWNCFLCEDSLKSSKNLLLRPRDDFRERIRRLFSAERYSISHYAKYYKGEKRRIRVLSLFDGISTGLLSLRKLGLDIEAYFASEIDPDAELVSKVHFGAAVSRLGDVRCITENVISDIAPIDLLIGGSPCNDLSLVNPKRRGLHDPSGTGILFFDYCRIKKLIENANCGKNLFWLFENVASMPDEYKRDISKHLNCEPDLIDSAEFSPQHRPRYYWTNIPMGSYTPFIKDLEDVLTPNCNRHALVKKIRTVTTQLRSLKQGTKAVKPVIMNSEYDCLWTTELEEIFGFPRHYTDVKNLSATKRQKLIGQAWCVRTIMEILKPLKNYFLIEDSTSNDIK